MLECDPRLLGQDRDRPEPLKQHVERFEYRPRLRRLPFEMALEIVPAAGMTLVSVGECPSARRALPQWPIGAIPHHPSALQDNHSAPARHGFFRTSRFLGERRKGPGMTDSAPHAIEIAPFGGRVRVRSGGAIVADSAHAMMLEETGLPPVFYLPREDVRMEQFSASDRTSHCPHKGDASYFHLETSNGSIADAAWSYETPYPIALSIAGHLAFYPEKVEIETLPFG